jgi:hypothetical protein
MVKVTEKIRPHNDIKSRSLLDSPFLELPLSLLDNGNRFAVKMVSPKIYDNAKLEIY